MAQVTESDYRTAQTGDAKVRQDFLESIDLEESKAFVRNVSYSPISSNFVKEGYFTSMTCDSPLTTFFKIPLSLGRSTITAYPESFDFSYSQFMASIIKHEGQHARQAMYHPYFYAKIHSLKKEAQKQHNDSMYKYLYSLIELPAFANEFEGCNKFNLTDSEKYNTALRMAKGVADLHSYPSRNLKKDFSKIMCDTRGDSFAEKLIFEKDPSIFLLGK